MCSGSCVFWERLVLAGRRHRLSEAFLRSGTREFSSQSALILEAIQGHLTKGSIIAFDEINVDFFPGETIALKEVLGLDKYKLVHTQYSSARSYLVIE